MRKARPVLIVLIFILGCQHGDVPNVHAIINSVEMGTDSTYKREYFPNPHKSIYATMAKYYGAPIRTFVYYYDIDKKKVSEIKTYMIDSLYGHYFEFYANGNLKRYCYYVGSGKRFSYSMEYSKKGGLENKMGDPLVDYIKIGGNEVELYFSNVFFDSIQVEISSEYVKPHELVLEASAMLPMLSKAVMPAYKSLVYLKISGYRRKGVKIYNDTLRISH